MAEVRRDRARALARVSFGIGAGFICMHQAGKNKRIRACVSGALFVICHERNSVVPRTKCISSSWEPRSWLRWLLLAFERETVAAAFFSPFERLSRPVRHVTPFPFYFSLALFSNYTLILEISPIYFPILNNYAPNAAELSLKKYFKRVFLSFNIYN